MDFHDITPDMKQYIDGFIKPWRLQNSEYTFTNLLMWGMNGHIKVAEACDTLYFLLHYETGAFMFAPLTRDPGADYAAALKLSDEYCLTHGIPICYKAVAGPLKEAFERVGGYTLCEDRDNFDYVYSMEELLHLSGKKLHAKRNHINQFRTQYQFEYVPLRSDMMEECLSVYKNWLQKKDMCEPGVIGEFSAIRAILANMGALGVVGGGIRINGELGAFTLGERIDGEMAVIHIEKADDINGLYTMINQQFIEHEFTDMKLINREEDMGLPGLRKAKLSYYPVMLLEKFEATRE